MASRFGAKGSKFAKTIQNRVGNTGGSNTGSSSSNSGSVVISPPSNFREGIHIGYDQDNAQFSGVPEVWKQDLLGSTSSPPAQDRHTNLPSSIAPSRGDLEMLRKAEQPRRAIPTNSLPPPPPVSNTRESNNGNNSRSPPSLPPSTASSSKSPPPIRDQRIASVYETDVSGSVSSSIEEYEDDDPFTRKPSSKPLEDEYDSEEEEEKKQFSGFKKGMMNLQPMGQELISKSTQLISPVMEKRRPTLSGKGKNDNSEGDVEKEIRLTREDKDATKTIQRRLANSSSSTNLDLTDIDLVEVTQQHLAPCYKFSATIVHINLGFNKLRKFPAGLGEFKNLQYLFLDGNCIASDPASSIEATKAIKEIAMNNRLRKLTINGSKLENVPPAIGLLGGSLEVLELKNNLLNSIPAEIGYLTCLEELHLVGNPLLSIPPEIGLVKNLEILDCSCCQLDAVPPQLCYLWRLVDVNLGSNQLKSLPEPIGLLTRLANLNCGDNHLTDLPISMGIMSLERVDLENNCWDNDKLAEKLKMPFAHLMDYLEKRLNEMMPQGISDDKEFLEWLALSRGDLPYPPPLEGVAYKPPPVVTKKDRNNNSGSGGIQVRAGNTAPKDPEMEKKIAKLKELASGLVKTIQTTLLSYKRELSELKTIESGIPLAKLAVGLKNDIEAGHKLVAHMTVALRQAPPRTEGEDKLLVLKRTVAISFDNLTAVVSGLSVGINKCGQNVEGGLDLLVKYVTSLKSFYSLLERK